MTPQCRITAVIPTLEEGNYLPLILMDIKSQTIKPGEIIVVDANSKDKTRRIARSLGARVITSDKPNAAYQRNLGAKAAKGNILVFIDADVRLPDKSILKEVRNKSGSFSAAASRIKVISLERNWKDRLFCIPANLIVSIWPKFCGRGAFMAVDRRAFEFVGGFDVNRTVTEDVDLFRRIGRIGKVICLDKYVEESPRRYRSKGHLNVFWSWTKNAVYAAFTGYSKDKSWEAVR